MVNKYPKPKYPVRIIFEFNDGTRYVLEKAELGAFMEYIDEGISLLYTHNVDMEVWNKLMRKIYGGGSGEEDNNRN